MNFQTMSISVNLIGINGGYIIGVSIIMSPTLM